MGWLWKTVWGVIEREEKERRRESAEGGSLSIVEAEEAESLFRDWVSWRQRSACGGVDGRRCAFAMAAGGECSRQAQRCKLCG